MSKRITLLIVLLAGVAACTSTPRSDLPLPYHGDADQVLTVVAEHAADTNATLTAWQRISGGWRAAIGPLRAYVGRDGIGRASEDSAHTPAGVWTLSEAFGIAPNDGTRLPYRQVGAQDWWVSDTGSPSYNHYAQCASGTCEFDEQASENLGQAGPAYEHAVVIDYNRQPVVAGAGSAFFLHVETGRPTAGCVSIPAADLEAVMRWLDPSAHPVINIGSK
ncbi:L,D-transpeptidase family protein [Nocardia vinacea]|uniref:L,D-transpeptidase family protein n=1 Tax=Nocardia vinacea TaxID=96468 RepID=UPI0002E2C7BE|nr:L,D-transpeptidase family protein [Nocardia vinacea]